MNSTSRIFCLLFAMVLTGGVQAQTVEVKNAWARATVQGQKATGAFMQITAPVATTLIGVSTPVAGVAEIHEMKMDGDVMRMRPLTQGLKLPAGKAVQLQPGGYHLMLMDLKVALQKDSTIPLTLTFKDSKGVQSTQELRVPVRVAAPAEAGHHQHGN